MFNIYKKAFQIKFIYFSYIFAILYFVREIVIQKNCTSCSKFLRKTKLHNKNIPRTQEKETFYFNQYLNI